MYNCPDFDYLINPKEIGSFALGFLWGDGFISNRKMHRIDLTIMSDDANDIEHIYYGFNIKKRHRKNRKPSTTFMTGHKSIVNFLCNFDYNLKSGKSANKILNYIPLEYHRYWWLGYFNADGCFYYNQKNLCRQLSIASCYEQDWDFVEKLFESINIRKYKIVQRIHSNSKSSIVRITNLEGIVNFGNYIYDNQFDITFGFKRKYDKYQNIISSYV
jgi:DNA-binding transcriptional regulator WhiA